MRRTRLGALIAISVLLPATAIAKSVVIKSGSYTGTTSEKNAITFKVSGHTLKGLKTQIGYNGKCGQGGGPGFTIKTGKISIKSNGTFSAKILLHGPVPAVPNHKAKLSGRASGSRVTGSIVGIGFTFNHCNGYTETFKASRH